MPLLSPIRERRIVLNEIAHSFFQRPLTELHRLKFLFSSPPTPSTGVCISPLFSNFNRPHFCLQFSAPIDSPRPVFPPPPVERNTLDPSRQTRKYSVLLEKLPQQQCKFSNVQDKHNQKSYERPAAHFSRLPAQLISTNCQWSATGYSSESERSCGPGGRRTDDGAGCRRRHQIRLRLPPRSTPLRHKTRRGWGGGYRGMRFSWLRVIADCHFSVIRKKIFSTPSLAVARIRNRTARGGRARGGGLNCTRAPRRRPSPSPPCSSIPWFVKGRQIFGSVTLGQIRQQNPWRA